MYLMIDHFDSFVYNLASYFEEIGRDIVVVRQDQVRASDIEKIPDLEGLILSPGPKRPEDAKTSLEILEAMKGKVPILGVCLGHQMIAQHFGASIIRGVKPMHGKVTDMTHAEAKLFLSLPQTYKVTRYHSLVVSEHQFPESLVVDARAEDGVIMAISHKTMPIYGIQFHPEAVLTEYGHEILMNFVHEAEAWRKGEAA